MFCLLFWNTLPAFKEFAMWGFFYLPIAKHLRLDFLVLKEISFIVCSIQKTMVNLPVQVVLDLPLQWSLEYRL